MDEFSLYQWVILGLLSVIAFLCGAAVDKLGQIGRGFGRPIFEINHCADRIVGSLNQIETNVMNLDLLISRIDEERQPP